MIIIISVTIFFFFESFDTRSGLGLMISAAEIDESEKQQAAHAPADATTSAEFKIHVYDGEKNQSMIMRVDHEEFAQFYYCCLPLFFDNSDFIEKVNNGEIKLEEQEEEERNT